MTNDLLKYVEKYKYNGIHFHFNGLYVFTEEQIINLANEINKSLVEENESLKMEIAGMEAAMRMIGKTVTEKKSKSKEV